MKPLFFMAALVVALTCSMQVHAQQKPNIILIIADDVSWNDIGCYGNAAIRTPHLDKMAKNGLRFTNAFVTSSSCSPSRTSILTGRYPHSAHTAELHTPLPAHMTFFPELLKKSGYYTAHAGKWHEGPHTRRAYDTLLGAKGPDVVGGEEKWEDVLRQRPKDKPFFCWFAALDAHRAWQPDAALPPHDPATVNVPPMLADTKETRADLAAYYNEIARLDRYIGELHAELQRQGIANNTVVIFMADNGRPFPGSKTRLNDAGVRTPFLVQWPEKIRKGSECDALISSVDIAPTLLELAGLPAAAAMQGKSFTTLFTQPQQPFREYVFTEHNWHDFEAYERAVRTKDYLYILNKRPQFSNQGPRDAVNSPSFAALLAAREQGALTPQQQDIFTAPRQAEELYAVTKDKDQMHNLAGNTQYTAVKEKLRQALESWRRETGDTEPAVLTHDWYERFTGKKTAEHGKRGEMPGSAAEK